jgi:uncharacterized membrane protein YhhN
VVKPVSLALLIAWFTLVGGWRGPLFWFGLALVFSLLGDIFLLKIVDRFILGLAAFLLAHLSYLVGFNSPLPTLTLPYLGLALLGVAIMGIVYPVIRSGLMRQEGGAALRLPVFIYSLVLALMMLSAVSTLFRPGWKPTAAILAATGGVLFLISDTILAVGRFVRLLRYGDLLVMITYHLGQIGLAAGAILNFA